MFSLFLYHYGLFWLGRNSDNVVDSFRGLELVRKVAAWRRGDTAVACICSGVMVAVRALLVIGVGF